jgi:DNA-directed RNA polymerase subunit RPC12/RpoP
VVNKQETPTKKCSHPGYLVKDGALVCASCGEPSPVAKMENGNIVPIPQTVKCPHCGGQIGLTVDGKQVKGIVALDAPKKPAK